MISKAAKTEDHNDFSILILRPRIYVPTENKIQTLTFLSTKCDFGCVIQQMSGTYCLMCDRIRKLLQLKSNNGTKYA